jgi:hypothetical protein
MSYDNEIPSAREVGGNTIKYGCVGVGALFVIGIGAWTLGIIGTVATMPVNTAVGVASRVMDPDAALQNYRWFRDARNAIAAQQANIKDANAGLKYAEEHTPDRVSARMTELTGAKQVCNSLVGEYNSRSERVDSRLFKDPSQFFTGLVDDQRPESLPVRFEYKDCE